MKTKTTGTVSVYFFKDLSDAAKEKARDWFREGNDDPMMQSHMINLLKEELEERKIEYDTDSINVLYSLSHSQGDGLMFEGTLYDERGNEIMIRHSGRYYHEYSRKIDYPAASEKMYADFEEVYVSICKKIAQLGYDHIEWINSDENIDEAMEANEYTFTKEGKRLDADTL